MANALQTDRRAFLKSAAAVGAGLVIGFRLPLRGMAAGAQEAAPAAARPAANAFLRIGADTR